MTAIGGNSKKIFISTIGSRGEAQPALALALELVKLGHKPTLCIPPNFKTWVESFGIECVPVGPDLQNLPKPPAGKKMPKPSIAAMRGLLRASLTEQFEVTARAAKGCHLILTAGDLQHAARSIAELHNIPYVHAVYCPVTLKSPDHSPPNLRKVNHLQNLPRWLNRLLWVWSDIHWNMLYRDVLNELRAESGLKPVKNVPHYIATQQPWLAVDLTLGPAPAAEAINMVRTGAWLLEDKRTLPGAVEEFLAAGEAPIYFGFGSMSVGSMGFGNTSANSDTSRVLVETARAMGRRAIISRGWANLQAIDDGADCIVVGDVNHQQLFPRVAAIVHHGGAGTTTTAASAGKPQVIVPHLYDQHYWAHRVRQLGIGSAAGPKKHLNKEKLLKAVKNSLRPEIVERAKNIGSLIKTDGAKIAAKYIVEACD